MRFDDRITTLLAWEAEDASARARVWCQLVDLLGQGNGLSEDVVTAAVARLAAWEADVSADRRRDAVSTLERTPLPALASYLAEKPELADLLAALARPAASPAAVPDAPDVDDGEQDMLDLVDPIPPASSPSTQIVDLLARIEAFRADRELLAAPDIADAELVPVEEEAGFAFRIDAGGRLSDMAGRPLPARCAEPLLGVDGHAAGAWRAGTGFADARLVIDAGPHAGEWRIAAEPVIDPDGRSAGYVGEARLPRADETAVMPPALPAPSVEGLGIGDAIGRLRDPLDAILEAVDPARLPAGEMRAAATEVAERGAALMHAVDALEIAVAAVGEGGLDAAALLVRIDAALQPLVEARKLKVSFRVASALPPVDADPQAVERMFARLIGAVIALGRRNEQVVARLGRDRRDGRMLALSITRPGRLIGRDPLALFDPPVEGTGADAPALALGFALRLVDRLAHEAGGRVTVYDDRIVLALPLRSDPHLRHIGRS